MKRMFWLWTVLALAMLLCACGEGEKSKTPAAEPHTHVPVEAPAVEPTCTKDGQTAGKVCNDCGEILEGCVAIPATGHKEIAAAEVLASCTENGTTAGKKCEVCGWALEGCTPIAATGHKEEIIPAVKAVNGKGGITEGAKCSVCGTITVEPKDPLCYVSRYFYDFLGTMENAKNMQAYYDYLWSFGLELHLDTSIDLESRSYSEKAPDFGLSESEAKLVTELFNMDNKSLFYWSYACDYFFEWEIQAMKNEFAVREPYFSGEERRKLNIEVYRTVQNISKSSQSQTTLGKAKDYHDSIVNNVSYSKDEIADWAHNVVGYFLNGAFVCEGYGELYSLVMNYNNIPCISVCGYVRAIYHEWNLFLLDDGKWYWADLTYDDTVGSNGSYLHNFFCINDTQIIINGKSFLEYDNRRIQYLGIDDELYFKMIPARAETPYVAAVDAKETVDAAFALEKGNMLPGARTLTGEITYIDTPYSEQYKNVTVTIKIDGTLKRIMCYRLGGDGADKLKVGDKITVTGNITNFGGTVEFAQGCTFVLAQ